MLRTTPIAVALFASCVLGACKRDEPAAAPTPAPAPAPAAAANPAPPTPDTSLQDGWLGQWTGPEGTGLTLSKQGERYAIRIVSLDGPNDYEGRAEGDRIAFDRAGRSESIRATDGAGTGMKWLAEKKDCLVIQTSEGFCRD